MVALQPYNEMVAQVHIVGDTDKVHIARMVVEGEVHIEVHNMVIVGDLQMVGNHRMVDGPYPDVEVCFDVEPYEVANDVVEEDHGVGEWSVIP